MLDSKIYNDGCLIVGRISGDIELQSFINSIFWQIDSRNVGEVQEGFSQLYYDDGVTSVQVTEDDVHRITEINTGTGIGTSVRKFRTALVLRHPEVIRLAKIHQALAREHGLEVEIFTCLEDGFSWIGQKNPEPEVICI